MNKYIDLFYDQYMSVDFINTGYGDCIYIELHNGNKCNNILIDGGRPGNSHYDNINQRIRAIEFLKKNNVTNIDLLVLTHLHEDHVGGLKEIAEYVHVNEFWCNYIVPEKYRNVILKENGELTGGPKRLFNAINIYNNIFFNLSSRNTKIYCVEKGIDFELNGAKIDVLWPDKKMCDELKEQMKEIYDLSDSISIMNSLDNLDKSLNHTSIILKIRYKNTSLLLPGDADHLLFNKYDITSILNSQILKLPHHGDTGSASQKLLESVNPQYVIVCVSNDWTFGCPKRSEIETISDFTLARGEKCKILFTDAVDMYPFSSMDDVHNSIRFIITEKGIEECKKIMF